MDEEDDENDEHDWDEYPFQANAFLFFSLPSTFLYTKKNGCWLAFFGNGHWLMILDKADNNGTVKADHLLLNKSLPFF